MTLSKACMNLSKVFNPGQAYVALSRVSSLKGLQLLGPEYCVVPHSCIKVNAAVLQFYEEIKTKSAKLHQNDNWESLLIQSISEHYNSKKCDEDYLSSFLFRAKELYSKVKKVLCKNTLL